MRRGAYAFAVTYAAGAAVCVGCNVSEVSLSALHIERLTDTVGVPIGAARAFIVTARTTQGPLADAPIAPRWASSDTSVIGIVRAHADTVVVRAMRAGLAQLTASLGGESDVVTLWAKNPCEPESFPVGGTTRDSVTADDCDGTRKVYRFQSSSAPLVRVSFVPGFAGYIRFFGLDGFVDRYIPSTQPAEHYVVLSDSATTRLFEVVRDPTASTVSTARAFTLSAEATESSRCKEIRATLGIELTLPFPLECAAHSTVFYQPPRRGQRFVVEMPPSVPVEIRVESADVPIRLQSLMANGDAGATTADSVRPYLASLNFTTFPRPERQVYFVTPFNEGATGSFKVTFRRR